MEPQTQSQFTHPIADRVEKIAILDFGGQYTHLIARRIRQLGVFSEILPADCDPESLKDFIGIIYSGGPSSVYDPEAPASSPDILDLGLPILGLCYGHQLITRQLGGEVKRGEVHEFGTASLDANADGPLFRGLMKPTVVWMSHGDEVVRPAPGFQVLATTEDCPIAAAGDLKRKIFGLQFHPEVTHTEEGTSILKNFLDECGAGFDWKLSSYLPILQSRIQEQCAERKVFLLVSGGVDSTVAFSLLNKTLGADRVLGLHIDNGLMRKNESEEVLQFLKKEGFNNLMVKDASQSFLDNLQGIYNPEEKRRIIGETFIAVKDEELARMNLDPGDWLLAQGTIYPDTIESGGTRNADVIKTHHNRVPGIMKLLELGLVVEPLSDLYKDEVRELGLSLGIPEHLIHRHPFPGPGLGVRLLCNEHVNSTVAEETKQKLGTFLKSKRVRGELLPIQSVGVQGDSRTYAHPCLIRGVRDWAKCETLSTSITNRFREVNRVVLEVGRASQESYCLITAQCARDKLDFLRLVDATCTRFLMSHDLYGRIWQMPVVLVPLVVGAKPVIVLRPVHSTEAMTAKFFAIPFEQLDELWYQLKSIGVGALLYDVTHKPPGTIEWE